MRIEEIFGMTEDAPGIQRVMNFKEVYFDEEGRMCITAMPTENHINPNGVVHGGYIYALADSANGTYMYYNKYPFATVSSAIQFYRPAFPNELLTAVVTPRKDGRTLTSLLVEVINDKGKLVADTVSVMYGEKNSR